MTSENRKSVDPGFAEKMMRFSLVMSFADKLLEEQALTLEEYADFTVKTAQRFELRTR